MNNYFSHDSNARNSDKLLPVRMKYGAEGYGIYFMILERLREEKNYMSVKDYNMLAFDLRVDTGKLKSIVEDFGLFAFTDDGKCFYSEGFNKRMEIKDEKSKKRSEAGKKGAAKRWQSDGNAIAKPTDSDSKESKGNETKGNETKQKQTKDNAAPVMSVYKLLETNGFGNPYGEPMNTDLRTWIEKLTAKGLSDEQIDQWLVAGVHVALRKNRRFWNFVEGVLQNWDNDAVYTLDAIEGENARRKQSTKAGLHYNQDDDEYF